ncbi:sulfate adenylyltransferase, partial [Haematococcus lacustris]
MLEVECKWTPNKVQEAKLAYGTASLEHPGVKMVAWERGKYYIGGKLTGFELPKRVFPCATPSQVRASLPPFTDIVVFQCRNPVHRAHYELFTRALQADNVRPGSVCLVHPTCGPTQDDDIPGIVRFHTYEVLKKELNDPRIRCLQQCKTHSKTTSDKSGMQLLESMGMRNSNAARSHQPQICA